MTKFIPLTKDQFAIVDDEDYEQQSTYKWCLSPANYAVRSSNRRSILMHRAIMNAPHGLVVDHINHNRLDNRKENLRIVTQAENTRNRSKIRIYPPSIIQIDRACVAIIDQIIGHIYTKYGIKPSRSAIVRRAIHELYETLNLNS